MSQYIDNQNNNEMAQNEQLTRQYSQSQFVQILEHLLSSENIQIPNIKNIYNQICQSEGKVTGTDILTTVTKLKERNAELGTLRNESQFYYEQIRSLQKKGLTSISVPEFQQLFANKWPQGQITKALLSKTGELDYISLEKLEKIVSLFLQNTPPPLHASSLRRSNLLPREPVECHEGEQIVELARQYISENVIEKMISVNLMTILENIQRCIHEQSNSLANCSEVEQTLRKHIDSLQDELYSTQQLLDNKTTQCQSLGAKLQELEEELKALNRKINTEEEYVREIQEEIGKKNTQILTISIENQELKTKFEWFKNNYQELSKQYQQYIQKQQQLLNKQKTEKEQRFFLQRTIKEQLEDSQIKITKLQKQNYELRQKNNDLSFEFQNKVNFLQNRIKQLQEGGQIRQTEKITFGDGEGIRNSMLYRSRMRSIQMESILSASPAHEVPNSIRQSVAQLKSILQSQTQPQPNFQKKKTILSVDIESQLNTLNDRTDSMQVQQSFAANDQLKNQLIGAKKCMNFLVFVIISDGSRHPIHLSILEDKLLLCDSKMRITQRIKLTSVKKIIFCYYNPEWVVLKLKSQENVDNGQNGKKQKNNDRSLNDYVFHVINRNDFLNFLHLRLCQELIDAGTKISFEKQDSVWVKTSSSEILLSNYSSFANLTRMSMSNAENLFQVCIKNLKSNSIFNTEEPMVIMVTNIGVLAFQKQGDLLLQKNQRLMFIIPIVQEMTIESEGFKIFFKYKRSKNSYQIRFFSMIQSNKFENIVRDGIKSIANKKKQEIQKYSNFVSMLNRSKNGIGMSSPNKLKSQIF